MAITATTHAPDEIRDPTGLWRWMRFFGLMSIISHVAVVLTAAATSLAVAGALAVSTDQATTVDAALGLALLVMVVFYFLSAFATLRLMYRLMKNAHALKSDEELTSPGWAVGWWFIPFAGLVMVPRAVGQIWRVTFRYLRDERGSAVIGWWWGLFITSNIWQTLLENFVAPYLTTPDASYYVLLTLGYVVETVCAVLLLVVFGTLAKAQKQVSRVADVFS